MFSNHSFQVLTYFIGFGLLELRIFVFHLKRGAGMAGMARPARKSSGWRAAKLRWKMH